MKLVPLVSTGIRPVTILYLFGASVGLSSYSFSGSSSVVANGISFSPGCACFGYSKEALESGFKT